MECMHVYRFSYAIALNIDSPFVLDMAANLCYIASDCVARKFAISRWTRILFCSFSFRFHQQKAEMYSSGSIVSESISHYFLVRVEISFYFIRPRPREFLRDSVSVFRDTPRSRSPVNIWYLTADLEPFHCILCPRFPISRFVYAAEFSSILTHRNTRFPSQFLLLIRPAFYGYRECYFIPSCSSCREINLRMDRKLRISRTLLYMKTKRQHESEVFQLKNVSSSMLWHVIIKISSCAILFEK